MKLISILLISPCYSEENNFGVLRVAHAGGGISGQTYTNSLDALNLNYEKGFQYFELDFSFTKDDCLVCIHDWNESFKHSFDFTSKERPTLETFTYLIKSKKSWPRGPGFLNLNKSLFEECTLKSLAVWMLEHPYAVIITDIKEKNIDGLRRIAKALPNSKERVIPQIYQPENFSIVKSLGFKSVIWTLYRYKGSTEEVLQHCKEFYGSFAITMPIRRAKTELPKKLKERNIPTYVHTINSEEEAMKYIVEYKISEVYTDFLHATQDIVGIDEKYQKGSLLKATSQ
jgi:glycerophosphoryl diester phosphodiesterase